MTKFIRKGLRLASAITVLVCHTATAQTAPNHEIEEIQVKSARELKSFRLGATHCFSTFSFSPGYRSSIVVRLKPPALSRLRTVNVGAPAFFGAEGIWRVVVFGSKNGMPDVPLLIDTVLIHANKKQRFYTVLLDSFRIQADTAGVFVGVEWMTKSEYRERGAPSMLSLKMVRCDNAAETFVLHTSRGWERFTDMESRIQGGGTSFTKAAISATFLPVRP